MPRNRGIASYYLEMYEHDGSKFVLLNPPIKSKIIEGVEPASSRVNLKPDTLYKRDLTLANDAGFAIIKASVTVRTLTAPDPADATLTGLTLRDIDFGTFDSATTSYTASVPNSVSNTLVSPTVDSRNGATFVISANGVEHPNFLAKVVQLNVGSNTIKVKVTSKDGETTKTYTVTVTRAAASGSPETTPTHTPTPETSPTPTLTPEAPGGTPTSTPTPISQSPTSTPAPALTPTPVFIPTATPQLPTSTPTLTPTPTSTPQPIADACLERVSGNHTIHGKWTTECESKTTSPHDEGTRYSRYFTFDLSGKSDVTITLQSGSIKDEDTVLYLRKGGDNREIGDGDIVNDDHGDDASNKFDLPRYASGITATLEPDKYTIEATTYYSEQTGAFTLTMASFPSAQ